MRVIMYGSIHPRALTTAPLMSDRGLAAQAITGKTDKGLELCDRLHARGNPVTVSALVEIACTGKPSTTTFDRLCDVVTTWHEIHSGDA